MKSKRIQWLDFGKGLTIFFVVLFHTLLYVSPPLVTIFGNCIGVFIMPVFFAISGYLYNPIKTIYEYNIFVYKKVSGLLIPYFIFSIIMLYIYNWYPVPKTLGGTYHFHSFVSLLFVKHITYLWYLYVLFVIFIIIGSLNLLLNIKLRYMIGIMAFIIIIMILSVYISGITLTNLFGWIVCFLIGYYLKYFKAFNIKKIPHIKSYLLYIIIIYIISIVLLFLMENNNNFNAGTDMFSKNDAIPKLLSIFLFFSIFFLFKRNNIFNYFCKYGKYTLSIYLIHFPLIIIVGHLINIIIGYNNNALFMAIFFIIIWSLSIVICVLINHIKYINYIIYPRHYLDGKMNKLFNK